MTRALRVAGPVLFVLLATRAAIPATPADTCAAAKLTAAGKKVVAKLACWGKAVKSGLVADDACLAKAEQKFTTAFAAAEAKGGCRTIGDATQVEGHVDDLVAMLVADEPGDCGETGDACDPAACCPELVCDTSAGPPTCQTSTTTTTVTTTTLVPCALSLSCGGSCPSGLHCIAQGAFPPFTCTCAPDPK
ncbi:MAG TPA: hypothetical protein VMS22_02475 [Candidatus Eisenbacteria bacterium]|nr:hypothetical protein [Candidatus Eisenbacteria bacterium]